MVCWRQMSKKRIRHILLQHNELTEKQSPSKYQISLRSDHPFVSTNTSFFQIFLKKHKILRLSTFVLKWSSQTLLGCNLLLNFHLTQLSSHPQLLIFVLITMLGCLLNMWFGLGWKETTIKTMHDLYYRVEK